jgi:hypothetical protein
MNQAASTFLRAMGVILLVALAFLAIVSAIDQYPGAETWAQEVQTGFQALLGVFSFLSLIVAFGAPRVRRPVFFGFIASLALASALAVTAWGDEGLLPALTAGVGSALFGWLIVWLVRAGADDASGGT